MIQSMNINDITIFLNLTFYIFSVIGVIIIFIFFRDVKIREYEDKIEKTYRMNENVYGVLIFFGIFLSIIFKNIPKILNLLQ